MTLLAPEPVSVKRSSEHGLSSPHFPCAARLVWQGFSVHESVAMRSIRIINILRVFSPWRCQHNDKHLLRLFAFVVRPAFLCFLSTTSIVAFTRAWVQIILLFNHVLRAEMLRQENS